MKRRDWLRAAGLSASTVGMSGWMSLLAKELANDTRRRRHCILLWMGGGPSQTDTFDMKPGHENGGEFKEIPTNIPGLRFSEHFPKLAAHADKLAVVRGLSTKEGDHSRGTHLMRTGHTPMGSTTHPAIGASLAKELANEKLSIPGYVSISPFRGFSREAFGSGYLGPKYNPLIVGDSYDMNIPNAPLATDGFAKLTVKSVSPAAGVTEQQMQQRLQLWGKLQKRFVSTHPTASPLAHHTVYESAVSLMQSDASKAFQLETETDAVRTKYGTGKFGQGCLMARRLIEQGVAFVEVCLNGWDTHTNNFPEVARLSAEVDAGWASLMEDLEERDLLKDTTILWMGEFGRTPQINGTVGRDHYPRAWTGVFAGGGIAGGQAYGKTSADGREVEDGKMGVSDLLATLSAAVGVPPETENISDTGRPMKIVDGTPVSELLG